VLGDGCCGAGHGRRDHQSSQMPAPHRHDKGWIRTLMEEAENERMHL
jgi:hypothetical protein